MKEFGSGVVGCTFKKGNIVFKVLEIEPYRAERVRRSYRRVLAMRKGALVGVPYRGIMIPNVTVHAGLARLTKVAVGGVVLSGPKAISATLGIEKAFHPYAIQRVE